MNNKKFLIVDDEKTTLTLINRILTEAGYETFQALTGHEALKLAQSKKPDLIIMDIVLPDIDGAEAVRMIHEDPDLQKIKVLFLSGIVTQGSDLKEDPAINVKNRYYPAIGKPIKAESFLSRIRKLLAQ